MTQITHLLLLFGFERPEYSLVLFFKLCVYRFAVTRFGLVAQLARAHD